MAAPRHLLVVDDQVSEFDLLVEALREVRSRLHVHHVESGVRALMFLARNGAYHGAPTPDLILLDLNMPGMSGLDLLVALKASAWSNIPVIMLTSSSRGAEREEAIAKGAMAFWTKAATYAGLCKMATVIQAWEAGDGSLRLLPVTLRLLE